MDVTSSVDDAAFGVKLVWSRYATSLKKTHLSSLIAVNRVCHRESFADHSARTASKADGKVSLEGNAAEGFVQPVVICEPWVFVPVVSV